MTIPLSRELWGIFIFMACRPSGRLSRIKSIRLQNIKVIDYAYRIVDFAAILYPKANYRQ